jgi:SOS-response transcriptional repressor LexA
MTADKRPCAEIAYFLQVFQDDRSDLPYAMRGYWKKALDDCRAISPNMDDAETSCNCLETIVRGLCDSEGDFGQMHKILSQVLILRGAVRLGRQEWSDARYYFDEGTKLLQHWDDKCFESLSHFGRTLAYKEEGNWPRALEVAQKALNAICDLPTPCKTKYTKELQERIKEEINSIVENAEKGTTPSRPNLVEIPIVKNIAAGPVRPIADENIEDYLLLSDNYSNDADFGVSVEGDSMKGDGILAGDLALIRQQPTVEDGEIAAVVITTPEETLGVIKRYHDIERESLQHWFLESNDPSSKHLLVMPGGANLEAIQALYAKEIQAGKVELYKNAELTIVGKYVGLVRRI